MAFFARRMTSCARVTRYLWRLHILISFLFFIWLAGWVNRNQQKVIEYLQEEIKILTDRLAMTTNAGRSTPPP
jgi:hypothetical protein